MKLYEAVMRHRTEGLSYNAIIRAVEDEFKVRLNKSHVSNWIRGDHLPDGSVTKFEPVPTEELGYVIGTVLGDGSTSICGDHSYSIKLRVRDRDFADAFAEAINAVLKLPTVKVRYHDKTSQWHVDVSSLLLQQFLRRPLAELEPIIARSDRCSAGFLRGFFDSEGNVHKGSVTATNTDKLLIKLVFPQLERLHIEFTGPYLQSKGNRPVMIKGKMYWVNHDCFRIRIRNHSRQAFLSTIGFKIKRKNDALAAAVNLH